MKPLSDKERAARQPQPLEELFDALQDSVHTDVGKSRPARTARESKRMKAIFLDIDGVLIRRRGGPVLLDCEPECVAALNSITDRVDDAEIIVSSFWRTNPSVHVYHYLASNKVNGRMWGATDDSDIIGPVGRQKEIAAVLDQYDFDTHVILDDMDLSDMSDNHVRCDHTTGLTMADADRAVAILNGVE